MHNLPDVRLLLTAGIALATVWLLQLGLAPAALFAAVATALATRSPAYAPCLSALPTLLAAMPQPDPAAASCPHGPVCVEGIARVIRADDEHGTTAVDIATRGGLLRIQVQGAFAALPGDSIRAIARCSPSSQLDEPDPIAAAAGACTVEPGPWSLPAAFARARSALLCEVEAIAGEVHAPFLSALTLGNGARVDAETAAAHRATGLSHLLAVSGAHAAMLAWLLGIQPFGGGRRRPVGTAHWVAALLTLFGYGAITGMEPPMFRALAGYALVGLGMRAGRQTSAAQALLWPAILSAVIAPQGVLSVSFCLSYAAVFGLALAGPARGRGAFERFVAAPVRASFWATAMTAPLTLLCFGQLAPWTIVLTPLLSPCIAALLLACLCGALLGAVGLPIDGLLAPPVRALADAYLSLLCAADVLPATPLRAPTTPSPTMLIAATAIAACCVAWRTSHKRILLASFVLCVPHFLPAPQEPARMELFAVGHGQCCLLAMPDGTTALIDCGSQQRPSLPGKKVERALRRQRIDVLVLTHGDFDHVGGLPELLRRVDVDRAWLPEAMQDTEAHAELQRAGVLVRFVAMGERLLAASGLVIAQPQCEARSDNDGSLWVRAQLRGWSALLTGDAEELGCEAAIAQGIAAPADVLVLPHHGRPNQLAPSLLRAVRPAFCLVSNERGDGYSDQGAFAMAHGIPTFATATAGDIMASGEGRPRLTIASMRAPDELRRDSSRSF